MHKVSSEYTGTLFVPCERCPLRGNEHFRDFDDAELAFVRSFKSGELTAERGTMILVEGMHSAHLFTLLSGWAFRHKTLEDGRRQILNYVLPGDLAGLQGSLMNEMQHSVEALTPVRLCVFERERLSELFERHASLSYDLTWIAAREERMLDEHLLSLGRRSALERAAYLLAFLGERAKRVGAFPGKKALLPLTQQHIADTLGLSLVHTNKTLRKLANRQAIAVRDRGCEVLNADTLMDIAGWHPDGQSRRPFI